MEVPHPWTENWKLSMGQVEKTWKTFIKSWKREKRMKSQKMLNSET